MATMLNTMLSAVAIDLCVWSFLTVDILYTDNRKIFDRLFHSVEFHLLHDSHMDSIIPW